jgi:hypothetical protein
MRDPLSKNRSDVSLVGRNDEVSKVKPTPVDKYLRKTKLPMVKADSPGDLLHYPQPFVLRQQLLHVDHPEAAHERRMFGVTRIAREEFPKHRIRMRGLDCPLADQFRIEEELGSDRGNR